jgi:hypothetical protein
MAAIMSEFQIITRTTSLNKLLYTYIVSHEFHIKLHLMLINIDLIRSSIFSFIIGILIFKVSKMY